MTETPITVSEALAEAMDFAREAWRQTWAAMAAVAAGWALIVVGDNAQLTDAHARMTHAIGLVLLLAHIPLLGALYRLQIGGRTARDLGPGGLQLGGVEWRLFAVNAVLAFFFLLACVPLLLVSGVLYMALRRFDGVTLGPFGHWEWWFLTAAMVGVAVVAALIYAGGRLSLATPFSIEHRRIAPWEGWPLTEGYGATIAAAFIIAHAPTLIAWLGILIFGWIEPADAPVGLHGPWPLPEAIGVGAVAGLLLSALQAPMSVGLISFFYDMLSPPEAPEQTSAETAVVAAPVVAAPAEILTPDHHSAEAAAIEDVVPVAEPEPSEPPPPEHADEPAVEPYGYLSPLPAEAEAHASALDGVRHVDEPASLGEPGPPPSEPEPVYPHSVVEYSPQSGRFSRLFSPWLAGAPAPGDSADGPPTDAPDEVEAPAQTLAGPQSTAHGEPLLITEASEDGEPSVEPLHAPPPPEIAEETLRAQPAAPPLDGAGEAGHAEP